MIEKIPLRCVKGGPHPYNIGERCGKDKRTAAQMITDGYMVLVTASDPPPDDFTAFPGFNRADAELLTGAGILSFEHLGDPDDRSVEKTAQRLKLRQEAQVSLREYRELAAQIGWKGALERFQGATSEPGAAFEVIPGIGKATARKIADLASNPADLLEVDQSDLVEAIGGAAAAKVAAWKSDQGK